MATIVLSPGQDQAYSSNITVGTDEEVFVGAYTSDGTDLPSGVVLKLQRQDINGNFITASTVGYGLVLLTKSSQQFIINTAGVYRVSRPDITYAGKDVGVYTE